MGATLLVLGIIILILLANSINILQAYERAVIFRLGKFVGVKGPGVVLIIPFTDKIMKFKLGKVVNASSDIDPYKGKISLNGQEFDAISEEKIKKDEKVKIVGIEEKNQFMSVEEEKKFVIKVKKKEV
jgi:regulator of protease activity HflC (stomatin/prohibitin superfamily)